MQKIHQAAQQRNVQRLFSKASITARPFFEAWGFSVEQEQNVQAQGIELKNVRMAKQLSF